MVGKKVKTMKWEEVSFKELDRSEKHFVFSVKRKKIHLGK